MNIECLVQPSRSRQDARDAGSGLYSSILGSVRGGHNKLLTPSSKLWVPDVKILNCQSQRLPRPLCSLSQEGFLEDKLLKQLCSQLVGPNYCSNKWGNSSRDPSDNTGTGNSGHLRMILCLSLSTVGASTIPTHIYV